FEQRIYNGENAKPGQFPYIVSLLINLENDQALCGGSIIDHTWILTAAHCTHEAKSVTIFYGSTKLQQGEFSHEVNADDFIQHEHYNDDTLENDIALIRTPHVDFSDIVNKVSLADRDNDYEGSWAVASGWGATSNEGGTPEDLQFADLQIKSKEECRNAINHAFENILCVSTSDGKTIGSGDSGGPLVTRDDPKLVGVSSFTLVSDELGPAGFCPVSAYRDWIRDHTGIEYHKVSAVDIFQHKHFNYITPENDIALIRTPHVDFSDLVNKVALADRDNDYEGSWAVASGWGDTFDGSSSAKDLQFADFQIKSKEECRNAINHAFDNILCVSTLHNKYTGNGDSGGPLVTRDDPKLVGVTSFGLEADGETVEHSPEFFCPVSAYRDWIRNHTGI
ncbi:hypothetical protein KR044_001480, partial [Drosophila immigrans]